MLTEAQFGDCGLMHSESRGEIVAGVHIVNICLYKMEKALDINSLSIDGGLCRPSPKLV